MKTELCILLNSCRLRHYVDKFVSDDQFVLWLRSW